MSPATVLLIIQAVQAAIAAAPDIAQAAINFKNFITNLFSSAQIDKATQDNLHAHVDAICAALNAGTTPPEFVVDADPS